MIFSIVRVVTALVTFFISVGAVLIFTVNHQDNNISDVQVTQIQSVPVDFSASLGQSDSLQPMPEFIFNYNLTKFYPRGYYSILGKKPKDFREFEGFELAAYEWDRMTSSDKPSGHITVSTYSNGVENIYYTETGLVTNKQITFIASPMFEEDFEYRFDGHFLKGGRVYKAGKNQAVVEGKLTKLKNGVKVAENDVKFRVEYLGC